MTKPVGLYCYACGKKMLRTVDTRPCHGGVRRRKQCVSCGERVTTIEKIVGSIRDRKREDSDA